MIVIVTPQGCVALELIFLIDPKRVLFREGKTPSRP